MSNISILNFRFNSNMDDLGGLVLYALKATILGYAKPFFTTELFLGEYELTCKHGCFHSSRWESLLYQCLDIGGV